jgi:two-component system response regulator ResD
MTERVLVVDDEPGMVRLLTIYLQQAGYTVLAAGSGDTAIQAVETSDPDLVLLDIGLPDIDGFTVARRIRERGDTPIIMLTARADPRDRLAGFEGGADDYVGKPFHPEELVARVRAVLRRGRSEKKTESMLQLGGLIVDVLRRTVSLDGQPVELRPKEFDLLAEMMRHPGQVFSRERLLERVWGYDFFGDASTVEVHVWRLRSKLGETRKRSRFIHTVWGVGYCLRGANDGP